MKLIMVCELEFSTPTSWVNFPTDELAFFTPTSKANFPNCRGWGRWGSRAAERGRHAAPAFFGRFIYFSRLGLFWRFKRPVFAGHGRTDDETGLPPNPYSRNVKSPKKKIVTLFWVISSKGEIKAIPLGIQK